MALTRAMLKGMGLTEEQVGAIIEEHTNVTTALKSERDKFKADAEEVVKVQKELEKLKKSNDEASNWEEKFNAEHEAFESYKKDVAEKENIAKIRSAYKNLLSECKVGEKHIDSILRVTDFSKLKLNDDGKFDDADGIKEQITADWSGFITTKETHEEEPENPPQEKSDDKGGRTGRAAELASKYHDNLYGKQKED